MKITIRPTLKQHEAWEALRYYDKVFFGGGAGGGKSWWLCETRLLNAYRYPGYKSFLAREELKRLMASTYITWNKVCKYHNIPRSDWSLNGQYNYIEFKNGSRIDLIDVKYLPSDPLYERFGSVEYSDGAIEECGEIHFLAYDVLKTRINRHLNDELGIRATMALTGNPKRNWTYTHFYLPFKTGQLPPDTKVIQSLYGDNPYTAKEYGKQLDDIKDKATKERLKYGNWDYEDDPTKMINYDVINSIFNNILDEKGIKYIVADIARFGSDRAIITVWDGWNIIEYIAFNTSKTTEIETTIIALARKYKVATYHIIIDEDGVGGGVVDHLNCRGFVNNSKAKDISYYNLKSECGYKLADNAFKINIKCALPETEKEMIREELLMLKTYESDKDNKLRILPKEKIKENIGRSPDWLDNFIMRQYFEIYKTNSVQKWQA